MLKVASFLGLMSVLVTAMLLISACAAFEDPAQRATENAQNTAMWTLVYGFQTEMPTMEALALTADSADFLGTQVAQVSTQNVDLRATNSALALGSAGQSGGSGFVPPTAIGGGQASGAFPTSSGGQPVIQLSPNPAASTPTSNPSGSGSSFGSTRYTQGVTSTTINDDGCASGITNSFTSSSSSVYFVVTVVDLQPGVDFSLRVSQNGTAVANDPSFWTSDDTYAQTCIWYNIDRTTMDFFAGTYVAELLADNQVAITATFSITGESADDMADETGN